MIKRVIVEYDNYSMSQGVPVMMRVVIDERYLSTDDARRGFANMLDEAVATAVAKWEMNGA